MDLQVASLIAISIVTGGSLIGIFKTKTPGFGRYSTSLIMLVLVLFSASVFAANGRLEPQQLGNILFAVAGFAGGLIAAKVDP
jgi:hypothetical protein